MICDVRCICVYVYTYVWWLAWYVWYVGCLCVYVYMYVCVGCVGVAMGVYVYMYVCVGCAGVAMFEVCHIIYVGVAMGPDFDV